jgi:hypothetical protein
MMIDLFYNFLQAYTLCGGFVALNTYFNMSKKYPLWLYLSVILMWPRLLYLYGKQNKKEEK